MTFEELQKIIHWAIESEWHQHQNGAGWVQNTATVAPTAYIGEFAIVYSEAQVCGEARVCGEAKVVEAISWAHCEGYQKWGEGYQKWVYFGPKSQYWIQAGCQWFPTFVAAETHWKDREDRKITRALLAGLKAELERRGLPLG